MFLFISGVSCGELSNGTKTEPVPSETSLSYGDNYLYKCQPGYEYDGDMIAACLATGTYSITPPTCTGKYTITLVYCDINSVSSYFASPWKSLQTNYAYSALNYWMDYYIDAAGSICKLKKLLFDCKEVA